MAIARENYDEVAWDRNDEAWEESQKRLRLESTCRLVESLTTRVCISRASLIPPIFFGGFNVLYPIRLEGHCSDAIVRLPCPDLVQFPEEKVLYEAATMRYFSRNATIPVPLPYHYSLSPEVGPVLILEYVKNVRDMSDALAIPDQHPDETPVLNPNIEEETLRRLYKKIAVILVQLSKPSFDKIGSLFEDRRCHCSVSRRPITQNMNNMIQRANIPRSVLPPAKQTYESADDWYTALAEMHIAQLLFQHNDLVRSEDDCRNKYVARQLFYSLAKQGRLSTFGFAEDEWSAQSKCSKFTCTAPSGTNSFRLWCDDLRPAHLLLNQEDDIISVIDWEFTYVAPTQFSLDSPWWLLLETPEMWSSGIEDWASIYDTRLKTWLSAMEKVECAAADLSIPFKLSSYMRESWASGRFWLNYASRKSWAFDAIYWKYLDERFFGPRETNTKEDQFWTTRVHLLGKEGRKKMETFVQRKMEEAKERVLIDWKTAAARRLLRKTLRDTPSLE